MADPFYRWNPIRHAYNPRAPIQPLSAKPKVVNIPVHYVGSDNDVRKQSSASSTVAKINSRVAAAVAIQRAVRGFLVRKNLRVVRQVAANVDEIERMVREEEDKIRSDPRERIRVSEGLMALLLRLDSVRGVRNFRKKVIQRVILLQEAVDSISDAGDGKISTDDIAEDREASVGGEAEESSIVHDQVLNLQETDKAETELKMKIPAAVVCTKREGDLLVDSKPLALTEGQEEPMSEAIESSIDNVKADDQSLNLEAEMNKAEMGGLENENRGEVEEEGMTTTKSEMRNADAGRELLAAEPLEGARGMREMMERMAVENESLKLMVAQLCETSADQCRLMEGLADRVNHLERAVHRNDRRKKRRSGAACPAFSSAK